MKEIHMECPICKKEMEVGFLESNNTIIWSVKKHIGCVLPDKEAGEFNVTKGIIDGSYLNAYLCRSCNIVVAIPYQKEKK